MNTFYNRFDDDKDTTDSVLKDLREQSYHDKLSINEHDVIKQFLKLNTRKAAGPDNVTPLTLKSCAHQLSPIYTHLFNQCTDDHIPYIWKTSTIVPVPKHNKPK